MIIRIIFEKATFSVIALAIALVLQLMGIAYDCSDFVLLITVPVTTLAVAAIYLNWDQIKSVAKARAGATC
jgi:hypothetical protein